jgi:DNA-binding response OmpR family regulator
VTVRRHSTPSTARPGLVLLDVQLPDMSGFDVCARSASRPSPDVILVSSRDLADYGELVDTSTARASSPDELSPP